MLLPFSKIKPYRIYGKSPVTLTPIGMTSKPTRNFVIMSLSDNRDFTFKLVNKNFIPKQYFPNYYEPKVVKIGGRVIRFTDRNKVYKDIKDSSDSKFANFVINPAILKGRNIVFNVSRNIETFNKRFIGKGKIKNQGFFAQVSKEYYEFMRDFGKDYAEKPIVMVDVSDTMSPSQNINSYFNVPMIKDPTVLQNFVYFLRTNKTDASGSLSEEMKQFLSADFIFYSSKNGFFFKVDFSDVPVNWSKFNRNIRMMLKLNSGIKLDAEDEQDVDIEPESKETEDEKDTIPDKAVTNSKESKISHDVINKFKKILKLDDSKASKKENELINNLTSEIESAALELNNFNSEAELVAHLDKKPAIKKAISDISEFKNSSSAPPTRDKAEKINKALDLSIKQLLSDFKAKEIKTEIIPKTDDLQFEFMRESKLKDFERSYNEGQSDKDIAAILTAFNDKNNGYPMRLLDVKRTDTSDDFNKKETLDIKFVDKDSETHSIKIDIPKFINDRFLYINNGKKAIVKQLMMLPIVKVKPDTVKVTTNYNIVHVTRFGSKIDGNINILKKVLTSTKDANVKIRSGSNKGKNKLIPMTVDIMELSNFLHDIEMGGKVYFSTDIYDNMKKLAKYSEITIEKDNKICVGYSKNKKEFYLADCSKGNIEVLNTDTGEIEVTDFNIFYFIKEKANVLGLSQFQSELASVKPPRKLAYSRVKMLNRNIPLIMILCSSIGLEELLRRHVKNDYKLIEDKDEVKKYKQNSQFKIIEFKDTTLVYKNKLQYNLMLNALAELDTKNIDIVDFNEQDFYLEYFNDFYGSRNILKGIDNFVDSLIDPITKDILNSLTLPENTIDVLIYCNDLLANTEYRKGNDISIYRVRSNEIINGYLYKILAGAYNEYKQKEKDRRGSSARIKMSVPQGILLKNLVEDPLINNFSTLNPFLELQDLGAVTFRGLGGINMADAIQIDTRSYDKSFAGILGISSPDSDKIGVVRQLTYNPSIVNNRGLLKVDDSNYKDLNAGNLLTPVELLGPYTIRHADPQRSQMFSVQSKHFMPTKEQSKPLIGTGAEQTVAHVLSEDFITIAKEDGVVQSIDEETGLISIKYKSGKIQVIDTTEKPSPNSGGGFYISNKKESDLKIGQKFKKDEVLARNKEYFLDLDHNRGVTLTNGRLTKTAFTSGWFTFEDSCVVTEGLANAMSSKVTMKKVIKLGPNTNIMSIKKKGDEVKTGEALTVFEQSFDDAIANQVLDAIGSEMGETISEMSRNTVLSKYTGEIVDFVIYYNQNIEDMSPSIQTLINEYISTIEKRRSILETSSNKDDIILPSISKVDPEMKINGEEFEGVMIEFYIRYEEPMMVGSKLTAAIALKSIIADVIPTGDEPFSDFRKDENIDIIISPLSIINRMTTEIMNLMYGNKVLIELKNKVKEMW